MLFIQSLMPHTVPGVPVLIALILHLHVVVVDDGRGKVNQGVLFVVVAVGSIFGVSRSRGVTLGVLVRW